jgi:acetyl-CoA C-acetyltransferase/acetyl-CoA acyltransferase 2
MPARHLTINHTLIINCTSRGKIMTISNALSSQNVYVVDGKRTPFGKFGGSLTTVSPVDLAVHAGKGLLDGINIDANNIDQFILGNVVPTTPDAVYGGRHLGLKLGADITSKGHCVNRLCGSGIQSIYDAVKLILLGESHSVLAAGTENMSNIPHLVYGSRFGTKYGPLKTVDMLLSSLTDEYAGAPMGITAENLAEKYNISREESDRFAVSSHQKVEKAYSANHFSDEIISIEMKRGVVAADEHYRESVKLEDLQKLRPSFKKDGVVTAATASGVVDGAATVLIANDKFCEDKGLTPLAKIIDIVVTGVDPSIMGIGPVSAIQELLDRNNLKKSDIDLLEINEAFAVQTLACLKELDFDEERVNIWGGAIALGHPLAASGTRITLTLAKQLKKMGLKRGIASACIGGGQGIGILIESL